jgi:hypothetical protein
MKRYATLTIMLAALAMTHCDRGSSTTSSGGTGGGPTTVKTAMDACRRFEAAGAAKNCREESVEPALTPGAKQRVLFDLPSGKPGQVFSFGDKDDYEKSAKSIEDLSSAGRHRWGNAKSKIYVQLNKNADDAEAQKIHDALDGF